MSLRSTSTVYPRARRNDVTSSTVFPDEEPAIAGGSQKSVMLVPQRLHGARVVCGVLSRCVQALLPAREAHMQHLAASSRGFFAALGDRDLIEQPCGGRSRCRMIAIDAQVGLPDQLDRQRAAQRL